MPDYHVFPRTADGARQPVITLQAPNDTAAWWTASSYIRAGSADVWQGGRFVGALSLAGYHARAATAARGGAGVMHPPTQNASASAASARVALAPLS